MASTTSMYNGNVMYSGKVSLIVVILFKKKKVVTHCYMSNKMLLKQLGKRNNLA